MDEIKFHLLVKEIYRAGKEGSTSLAIALDAVPKEKQTKVLSEALVFCFRGMGHEEANTVVAELLLTAGAQINNTKLCSNLNAAGYDGGTMLHWTMRAGKINAVYFLLDHGADYDHQDSDGRTPIAVVLPLRDACFRQRCIESILKRAPNLNLPDH